MVSSPVTIRYSWTVCGYLLYLCLLAVNTFRDCLHYIFRLVVMIVKLESLFINIIYPELMIGTNCEPS